MHVHDLNPKKTLWAVIIFVVLIIVGFITMKRPTMTYEQSVKQSVQMLSDTSAYYFYPYQLVEVLNHQNKDVVLIDIRNKYEFGQGHIPGAKSIPSFDLAKKENLNMLENYKQKKIRVVLYANNQLEATGAWFFFRQVGFENISVLLGGYDFYAAHQKDLEATYYDQNVYLKGVPRYDFAKVAKSAVTEAGTTQTTTKPVVFKRRKKATVAAGGC
ncbi:MAG: hypothetical protein JXR71_02265 [Bacteroidales bacterium]|nr:hypothetical protein [Bacteroidales bacterium]